MYIIHFVSSLNIRAIITVHVAKGDHQTTAVYSCLPPDDVQSLFKSSEVLVNRKISVKWHVKQSALFGL